MHSLADALPVLGSHATFVFQLVFVYAYKWYICFSFCVVLKQGNKNYLIHVCDPVEPAELILGTLFPIVCLTS